MTDPSLALLAAVAAGAALLVGFLKTSVGGGIGLALTPLMTLVLPAPAVLGLLTVMLCLGDPPSLYYYWLQWDRRQLRLLLPTVLVGILAGGWLLAGQPELRLRHLIGGSALLLALLQFGLILARRGPSAARAPWPVGAGVGLAGGIASAVAHSGGIVIGPYLAGLGLSNAAVVGTGSAVVAVSNLLKLATYWQIGFLSWRLVGLAVVTTPLLYLGSGLGYRLNAVIPRRLFALVLIGIAIAGSLKLLAS
ncbi:MAG: sulfite exporter TauE/SafE family protein [Candidatus Rokubacteria bacterium]|nr:sulfite exporter TauE/SafE family protein [Candidatus Rokubacteria bacterium]